jgi:N-acetylglucosaminyldiphosphoundecaprenol N-acetyl-beta-D-mannosaminyltransferase
VRLRSCFDRLTPSVRARRRDPAPPPPLRLGAIEVDPLTFEGALDAIERLVRAGRGGTVLTPNVDHVVQAERHAGLRHAYAAADLRLADGMPVLWAAALLGRPLPAKVSGSDLVIPLARRAARSGWRLWILGGAPGVAERAAAALERETGVRVAGTDAAQVAADGDGPAARAAAERIRAARPDLVLVALGAPKQELWMQRHRALLAPAVAVGVGAGIAFVAGAARRAPRWMSRCGLEWLYRLLHEPRRLWRRYLVDDPRFAAIVLRELRARLGRAAP